MAQLHDVGMIGLGVMGRNLALNIADHGFSVAGYDKDLAKGQTLLTEAGDKPVGTAGNVRDFLALLKPPRVVILLVAPAAVVDLVIKDLLPHLEANDLVIDAGNSYYKDTDRRSQVLTDKGAHYFGMGVSGGESGARHGPSLMPGGPRAAYERVRPILEAVAAKVGGEPCVAHMGARSAGHYVKMVHNGIEYGLMQLIAETYDLLKRGLGWHNEELHALYAGWNQGELNSFLVEITAQIFRKKDDLGGPGLLLDQVLGVARQKGTGQWTSQDALELHVAIPTIDAAVTARNLSGQDKERAAATRTLTGPEGKFGGDRNLFVTQLRNALYTSVILSYAQGMDLLRRASVAYGYGLEMGEVARIWRGGCIIRAALLEDIRAAYQGRPDLLHLLLDPGLAAKVNERHADLRTVVSTAAQLGLPAPALMASLAYLDSLRHTWLPANLIQAQRDLFGAHTYERVDRSGTFHSHWEEA